MARSVFYYHLKRLRRKDKYGGIRVMINDICHENRGRYGYRRVTLELRNRGQRINHKAVRRLMADMGLRCTLRVKRYVSYKGDVGAAAPNILGRDFRADGPNRKWATDVTQISMCGISLYLSPIIDMYNGEIISYNISTRADMTQIYDMLDKASRRFGDLSGLTLHSDQGWQYRHEGYRSFLKEHHIKQSMSRKGNCLDNAVAENFFGIMKSELLYCNKFKSVDEFVNELDEYIDYYNNKRIKLRLDGMSPVQYRLHSIRINKILSNF